MAAIRYVAGSGHHAWSARAILHRVAPIDETNHGASDTPLTRFIKNAGEPETCTVLIV
jgi:hypothetical protein